MVLDTLQVLTALVPCTATFSRCCGGAMSRLRVKVSLLRVGDTSVRFSVAPRVFSLPPAATMPGNFLFLV